MSNASFPERWWEGLRDRIRHERARRRMARGYDSVWLLRMFAVPAVVVVVCVCLLGTVAWAGQILPWAFVGFCALVMAYFVHLIFARLQCSLAEWIVLVLVLGNVEGLLLSTKHIGQLGWLSGATALLLAALILYGFVIGLAEAKLLGVTSMAPRLALILLNWIALPSPAILLCGLALWVGPGLPRGLRPSVAMVAWTWPLMTIGLVGVGTWIALSLVTRRRAYAALGNVQCDCPGTVT